MPLPHDTDDDEDPDLIDMPQWLREVCSTDKSILSGRQRSMAYSTETLGQMLDKVEKSLNGEDWREAVDDVQADLDDVRDRAQAARAHGASLAKSVDQDIQDLHHRINALKLTPCERPRALTRRTPWSRRCIRDTPAWACRRYILHEIWSLRSPHP